MPSPGPRHPRRARARRQSPRASDAIASACRASTYVPALRFPSSSGASCHSQGTTVQTNRAFGAPLRGGSKGGDARHRISVPDARTRRTRAPRRRGSHVSDDPPPRGRRDGGPRAVWSASHRVPEVVLDRARRAPRVRSPDCERTDHRVCGDESGAVGTGLGGAGAAAHRPRPAPQQDRIAFRARKRVSTLAAPGESLRWGRGLLQAGYSAGPCPPSHHHRGCDGIAGGDVPFCERPETLGGVRNDLASVSQPARGNGGQVRSLQRTSARPAQPVNVGATWTTSGCAAGGSVVVVVVVVVGVSNVFVTVMVAASVTTSPKCASLSSVQLAR